MKAGGDKRRPVPRSSSITHGYASVRASCTFCSLKGENTDACVLVSDPVTIVHVYLAGYRGPVGFTGMPNSGQLACKIVSSDRGFLPDIWQKCVFCDSTFIFLALGRLWVLIINISHTCSPAVGRKQSTFVFGKTGEKKKSQSWDRADKTCCYPQQNFCREIRVRKNVLKSGGSLEKPQLCFSGLRLVVDPPPRLLHTTAHQQQSKCGYSGSKLPFFSLSFF